VHSSDGETLDPERTVDPDQTLGPGVAEGTQRSSDSKLPTRLSHYVLLDRIGMGAMGIVLAAYDPKLDRRVAIKLLKAQGSAKTRRRLVREAQALAKVSHPNIVQIYEIGEVTLDRHEPEPRGFIVMEFVDGMTLTDWLQEETRSFDEIVSVLRQAGEGLAAAHAEGMVHRDFKPDNVMIRRDGRVLVMDFGLARGTWVDSMDEHSVSRPPAAESSSELAQMLTATGAMLGTPAYLAPEVFVGSNADARVDQFAFCVTLWEALHRKRPFVADSVAELSLAITTGGISDRSKGDVPRWLHAVLLRGLEVDPEARWPTMQALLVALDADPTRKRRGLITLAVVAAVGVAALLAWSWKSEQERAATVAQCQTDAQAMDAHWNDEVREVLRGSFSAAGAGDSVWEHTAPVMDAYAEQWSRLHAETCMSARVHKTLPESDEALMVACFTERRQIFSGILDAWSELDGAAVAQATVAAHRLPSIDNCTDKRWLALRTQAPTEVAAAVTELRGRLERAGGLRIAGRFEAAMEQVRVVEAGANELGWRPLQAETSMELGRLFNDLGKYEDSRTATEEALHMAIAGGHDIAAFDAATLLAQTLAWNLSQHDESARLSRLAAGFIERLALQGTAREAAWMAQKSHLLSALGKNSEALTESYRALEIQERLFGANDIVVAGTLHNIGTIVWQQGKYDEALEFQGRALAIRERILGSESPQVAGSLNNMGLVLWDSGRYAEAADAHRRALAIRRAVLDPGHVNIAASLNNLGLVQWNQGHLEQALESFFQALEIWQVELGPEHPDVALVHNNVGLVRHQQGRFEAALTDLLRAKEIRRKVYGPEHALVAVSTNNVGLVLDALDRHEEALAAFENALAIQRKELGEEHPVVGQTLGNIGSTWQDLNKPAKARTYMKQALAIREAALGPKHPDVAMSLHALAAAADESGDPSEARAGLERALTIRLEAGVDASVVAQNELLLGTVLWKLDERTAARAHIMRAQQRLEKYAGAAPLRAKVGQWLRAH